MKGTSDSSANLPEEGKIQNLEIVDMEMLISGTKKKIQTNLALEELFRVVLATNNYNCILNKKNQNIQSPIDTFVLLENDKLPNKEENNSFLLFEDAEAIIIERLRLTEHVCLCEYIYLA